MTERALQPSGDRAIEIQNKQDAFRGLRPVLSGVPILNIREEGKFGRFVYLGRQPNKVYPKCYDVVATYLGGTYNDLGYEDKGVPAAAATPTVNYQFRDSDRIQKALEHAQPGDEFALETNGKVRLANGNNFWDISVYVGVMEPGPAPLTSGSGEVEEPLPPFEEETQ